MDDSFFEDCAVSRLVRSQLLSQTFSIVTSTDCDMRCFSYCILGSTTGPHHTSVSNATSSLTTDEGLHAEVTEQRDLAAQGERSNVCADEGNRGKHRTYGSIGRLSVPRRCHGTSNSSDSPCGSQRIQLKRGLRRRRRKMKPTAVAISAIPTCRSEFLRGVNLLERGA